MSYTKVLLARSGAMLAFAAASACTGDGSGGSDDCATPAEATIDATGGEIAHCGATLVVPPGGVAEPTTFRIAVVEPAGPPPYGHEFISRAYDISADKPLAEGVSLTIEHTPADGFVLPARALGASGEFFEGIACTVTDTSLELFTWYLGTWAVVHDPTDYPDSIEGLGDGTIAVQFQGEDVVYDLDGHDSHGVYFPLAEDFRIVHLVARREVPGGYETVSIDIGLDDNDGPRLAGVSWFSSPTASGHTYADGGGILIGSDGAIDLEVTPAGRLVGTLSANTEGFPQPEPFAATVDVAVELYRAPPTSSCNE